MTTHDRPCRIDSSRDMAVLYVIGNVVEIVSFQRNPPLKGDKVVVAVDDAEVRISQKRKPWRPTSFLSYAVHHQLSAVSVVWTQRQNLGCGTGFGVQEVSQLTKRGSAANASGR